MDGGIQHLSINRRQVVLMAVMFSFSVFVFSCTSPTPAPPAEKMPSSAQLPRTYDEKTKYGPSEAVYVPIDACLLKDKKLLVLYGEAPGFKWMSNSLVKFSETGELEAEYDLGLSWAHSLSETPKGTFLITDHAHNRIVEVDENGNIVSELPPKGAESQDYDFNSGIMISNGNILASILGMNRFKGLAEFAPSGKMVWKHETSAHCHDATLLENGHILFTATSENKVVEINRAGKTVWMFKHKKLVGPKNARRMKNGHTLITHSGGIWEVSRFGKIVRERTDITLCYNFKVLPSGNILLTHPIEGVILMNPEFQTLKTLKYRGPKSFDDLRAIAPPESLKHLKSLGYL